MLAGEWIAFGSVIEGLAFFLPFWFKQFRTLSAKCGRSPRGSPVVIHQLWSKPRIGFPTTQLMIGPLTTFNRHENPTVKNQVNHHPLPFLAHKSKDLWPWRGFHSSHMTVWVRWYYSWNGRYDILISVNRSWTDILAESLTQKMVGSAIWCGCFGEYHPNGKIDDLRCMRSANVSCSDNIPTHDANSN